MKLLNHKNHCSYNKNNKEQLQNPRFLIQRVNRDKFYIRKTSKNLHKRLDEHEKYFKTGNSTNSLVSYNISTNHTFDFENSAIFAFIHDRDKRRIIQACSIPYHNTIPQRQFFFSKYQFLGKIILFFFQKIPSHHVTNLEHICLFYFVFI